ncbi:NPC intracellular cholesterol transporter 2-like [Chironomus tepperi]|uniref:NPC intracellular cholesterol transporter 2-like n=1 Tax=Chironomus tepperi TaxID=113505 RepID=UPI00391F81E8
MLKIILCLTLIASLTYGQETFWSACPNSNGVAPDLVESDACSGTLCQGQRGTVLTADVTFTPRQNHNNLEVRVFATILGITVLLPSEPPHDNACNSIFLNNQQQQCPIQGQRQYVWKIDMPIPQSLPALNTRIRYEIWDGTTEAMCAIINAILT